MNQPYVYICLWGVELWEGGNLHPVYLWHLLSPSFFLLPEIKHNTKYSPNCRDKLPPPPQFYSPEIASWNASFLSFFSMHTFTFVCFES